MLKVEEKNLLFGTLQTHSHAMNGGLFILLGALIEQECQERVQKMIKEEIQIQQANKVNLAMGEDITDLQTPSSCQNNATPIVDPEVIVHSKC